MSISIFNNLMTHQIELIKRARTKEGNFKDIITYSEKGFCQYGNKMIKLKTGEEIMSTAIIFLKNDSSIDVNHEYWKINHASQSRPSMEVLQIDPVDDPTNAGNTHHYECIVR
ncbi:MAG: hypothetical protein WC346_19485 [Methanogenium sp.]|jgi:hypothetical protein